MEWLGGSVFKPKEFLKMFLQFFVSLGEPVLNCALLFKVFVTRWPSRGAELRFEGVEIDSVRVNLGEHIFHSWVTGKDKVSLLCLSKEIYIAPG